jgi:Na+/melibiose symporter-like transporter
MLAILDLDHFSTDALLMMAVALVIGAAILGYLIDILMGDRGFGPVGNAILAGFGAFLGVYARNALLGRLLPDEALVTGAVAACAACVLLLALGIVKRWAQT